MELENRQSMFQDFLDCAGVMLWHYDHEMRLLSGTGQGSPYEVLLGASGSRQAIWQYCLTHELPGFCADAASLLWLAVPRYEAGALTDIYIIGPAFGSASSEETLRDTLRRLQIPKVLTRETIEMFRNIPVVQAPMLIQYGVLLCRCLIETERDGTDFQAITGEIPRSTDSGNDEDFLFSRNGTYAMEQEIFKAVEDGNIYYQHPPAAFTRRMGELALGDPLRHAKNQTIACVTLLARAAIRGGLPEGTVYPLSDWYIQTLETFQNVAEVYQLTQDAFADFTRRVHKCKLSGHSREIQECMSYIELHFQENLSLEALAKELGYSKSHLSTKFSRETGMSISDYTAQVKITYAKLWLKNSNRSIREISNDLDYSSVSYFSSVFRKQTGMSPSEFRTQT